MTIDRLDNSCFLRIEEEKIWELLEKESNGNVTISAKGDNITFVGHSDNIMQAYYNLMNEIKCHINKTMELKEWINKALKLS